MHLKYKVLNSYRYVVYTNAGKQAPIQSIQYMCDAKVISHKGTAVISRCAECQCVFLWHQNLVLSFSPEQFVQFRDFIREMAFDNHTFPFPDGQERVVMRTPANDLQLTFTMDEWDDMHAAMEEAVYMQEIYSIMERAN